MMGSNSAPNIRETCFPLSTVHGTPCARAMKSYVFLCKTGAATGEYQDFLTGFVPDGHVWGRPVGVTVAHDGSLLVRDDGSNSIWQVSKSK